MAASLNDFLAQANSSTIRANNQYELICTSGYSDIDKVMQKVTLYGQDFQLPERQIEYANVSFKGYEMQNIVPVRIIMGQEHTVNVLADVNGEIRRAFLAWQGKVINPDIEGGSVFEGDRGINEKSLIRINLFDTDNKTVIETYKFWNVRITNVGTLELTYEGGTAAKFQVTFKSTYWQVESATKGAFQDQK